MKVIFTKLPPKGIIKVSLDNGVTFKDYNVSDVSESGIVRIGIRIVLKDL